MAKIVPLRPDAEDQPTSVKRKVPKRKQNSAYRKREFLTEAEINRMLKAIPSVSRYPERDKLLVLMGYRHALRVAELIDLMWTDIDLDSARLHVKRVKNGLDATHPIQGDVLRLLRTVKRSQDQDTFVFLSERGAPLTASSVRYLVRKAGDAAGLTAVHPHMLRHSCGYYLANQGVDTRTIQEYMGHASITNTVRYTQLAANKFRGLWKR